MRNSVKVAYPILRICTSAFACTGFLCVVFTALTAYFSLDSLSQSSLTSSTFMNAHDDNIQVS